MNNDTIKIIKEITEKKRIITDRTPFIPTLQAPKELQYNKNSNNSIYQKQKRSKQTNNYKAWNNAIKAINQQIFNRKKDTLIYNDLLITEDTELIPKIYTPETITSELIEKKQQKDPIIFAIYCLLKENNRSLIDDIPDYLKRYVLSGRFKLKNGSIVMYQHGNKDCYVIPASLRKWLLSIAHGNTSKLMHHGTRAMQQHLCDKYWWPKMYDDINEYNNNCINCPRTKQKPYKNRGKMKLFPANAPFETVHIDLMGPLPQTPDGNRYILSMIDRFSRYCMLIPLQNIRAMTVVRGLERWLSTFGPPKCILSDNGSQFLSAIFELTCKVYGIKQKFTTIYHPQCNAVVERLHRWIKERLVLIALENNQSLLDGTLDWSEYLSIIQYTYNNTPNQMTSYAPSHIILGKPSPICDVNEQNQDQAILLGRTPKRYIEALYRQRQIILNNANARQIKYDQQRKQYTDKNTKNHNFKVGDYCMYDIAQGLVGNKKKLQPNFVRPYEIIDIFNDGQNFRIRKLKASAQPFNTHLIHIRPFTGNKYKSPEQIALKTLRDRINNKSKPNHVDVIRMNQILGPTHN